MTETIHAKCVDKNLIEENDVLYAAAQVHHAVEAAARDWPRRHALLTDEQTGERPVAAVKPGARRAATPASLRCLVAESVAAEKQVRDVLVVKSIARLPSGKALRRGLRERWEPVLATASNTQGSRV